MKKVSSVLFRLISLCFSILMLVLCLLARIELEQTEKRLSEKKYQIEQTEKENALLRIKLENAISLEELDAYAVGVLGMQHPAPGQVIFTEHPG